MTKACFICGKVEFGIRITQGDTTIELCRYHGDRAYIELEPIKTARIKKLSRTMIMLHAIATSDPPSIKSLYDTLQMDPYDAKCAYTFASGYGYVSDLRLTDKGLARLNEWKNKEGLP